MRLAEAEVKRLEGIAGRDCGQCQGRFWCPSCEDRMDALLGAVEECIDVRLAPIRALADEWADADGEPVSTDGLTALTVTNRLGRALRAALSADLTAPDATDDPKDHRDADEALQVAPGLPSGEFDAFYEAVNEQRCRDCGAHGEPT